MNSCTYVRTRSIEENKKEILPQCSVYIDHSWHRKEAQRERETFPQVYRKKKKNWFASRFLRNVFLHRLKFYMAMQNRKKEKKKSLPDLESLIENRFLLHVKYYCHSYSIYSLYSTLLMHLPLCCAKAKHDNKLYMNVNNGEKKNSFSWKKDTKRHALVCL